VSESFSFIRFDVVPAYTSPYPIAKVQCILANYMFISLLVLVFSKIYIVFIFLLGFTVDSVLVAIS
jgi:hypothetical protein